MIAIVIAVIKPSSKTQVWFLSVLVPISFVFFYGICVIFLSGSKLPLGYQLGGFVGSNVPSIIISILTLFLCLKKKFETKEDYRYPKSIIIVIIICAIIGSVQLYLSYQSRKAVEQYMEITSYDDTKVETIAEDDSYIEKMVHEEMSEVAQSYNKHLPKAIDFGKVMLECKLDFYSLVYTIEWKGMTTSNFSDDTIVKLRESLIGRFREEQKSPKIKKLLKRMQDYGYDFVYRYVNENGEELCSINFSPLEI